MNDFFPLQHDAHRSRITISASLQNAPLRFPFRFAGFSKLNLLRRLRDTLPHPSWRNLRKELNEWYSLRNIYFCVCVCVCAWGSWFIHSICCGFRLNEFRYSSILLHKGVFGINSGRAQVTRNELLRETITDKLNRTRSIFSPQTVLLQQANQLSVMI